jgi:hypothetical protein
MLPNIPKNATNLTMISMPPNALGKNEGQVIFLAKKLSELRASLFLFLLFYCIIDKTPT